MEDAKLLTDGEVIKNRDGSERLVRRAASGMFRSRKEEQPTREEAQSAIVSKITKIDAEGSSVLERILDNQIASATTPAAQPLLDKLGNPVMVDGKPLTVTDSKTMMASAKAAQVVLKASGLEQPPKEVEQPFKVEVVNITVPPEMLEMMLKRQGGVIPEVTSYRPPRPSFAEVTEIVTNEG